MKIRHIILLLLTVTLFASCKTVKSGEMTYFEDLTPIEAGKLSTARQQLTLQPDDEIAISVSSEVPDATRHFNLTTSDMSNTTTMLTTNRMQQTYVVNPQGDIDFPSIGMIHVQGMTTTQLKDYLVERISKTVKDPMVKVSLVNFRVNVIGEVKMPQVVNPNSERLTILEALAVCEDLTEFGDRRNVRVIRELPDGTIQHARLNLQDSQLTSSPYYYLQQNDVVYVAPNDIKADNSSYRTKSNNNLTLLNIIVSSVSVLSSIIFAIVK